MKKRFIVVKEETDDNTVNFKVEVDCDKDLTVTANGVLVLYIDSHSGKLTRVYQPAEEHAKTGLPFDCDNLLEMEK